MIPPEIIVRVMFAVVLALCATVYITGSFMAASGTERLVYVVCMAMVVGFFL